MGCSKRTQPYIEAVNFQNCLSTSEQKGENNRESCNRHVIWNKAHSTEHHMNHISSKTVKIMD